MRLSVHGWYRVLVRQTLGANPNAESRRTPFASLSTDAPVPLPLARLHTTSSPKCSLLLLLLLKVVAAAAVVVVV